MKNGKTAQKILFAGLCAIAIFTGLWALLTGSGAVALLVAGVMFLIAAQLILFVVMSGKSAESHDPEILKSIEARLGNLEKQIRRLSRLRALPDQNNTEASSTPVMPTLERAPDVAAEVPAQPFSGPAYLNDQRLSLYLEPVVDISSRVTMFYRAELAFETGSSGKIRIADMAGKISNAGHSADVDMKLFNRLGPVITKLAEKGRLAGVICPMSQHSFSNQVFLEELTLYLKQYPDLARVLVIEISQENLANLSQEGMAGLAFLAQIGATFCLGGAGLESPDLDSLASLGFRYLDLDYTDNVARYGLQAFDTNRTAAQLRDTAQKVDIQLIGSGFTRKSQCDALNHIIKFGRGTVFSAPRLVRADFARQNTQNKAA
ncbi:hypothetical protein MNBD_ALPHA08-2002 [hydrothermal vent metagenome]|uniref:EAL domain-containing protein n=1 Tax=hydrothermal vent metagenome TaxID=652676 RepID=A0A3B0RYB3_9ZZZZ